MAFDETIKNKSQELGGQAKETTGKVTGDEQLEAEGKADQFGARLKQTVNEAGENIKDAAQDVTEAIKDRFDKQ